MERSIGLSQRQKFDPRLLVDLIFHLVGPQNTINLDNRYLGTGEVGHPIIFDKNETRDTLQARQAIA